MVNTLTELAEITSVQFTFDRFTRQKLNRIPSVSGPLFRNFGLIEKAETEKMKKRTVILIAACSILALCLVAAVVFTSASTIRKTCSRCVQRSWKPPPNRRKTCFPNPLQRVWE